VGVLVTRPLHQSEALAQQVRDQGGDAVIFPAMAIEPLPARMEREMTRERMAGLDIAIFASPNAARIAMGHMARVGGLPPSLRIAAIGPATAAELKSAMPPAQGERTIITAPQGFDSEALLEALPAQEVAGRRIGIIRGEGGRELLGRMLQERGARVEYFECYRRVRPSATLDALLPRWRSGEIGASIATSAEIVENLYAMAGDAGLRWIRDTPMFVPHPRVAAAAYRLSTRTIVVTGAGDAAMAKALATWFGRTRTHPAAQSNS
jgi:uroporphyrinogen-III synthase